MIVILTPLLRNFLKNNNIIGSLFYTGFFYEE